MSEIPWFKVDDALYSHPKWLATPAASRALWATAGSWCAAQLTDGFVPRHVLPILGGRPRDAAGLVASGLWEDVEGGWQFHEWTEVGRQPTRKQVLAERADAAERQQRARDKAKASRRDEPVTDPVTTDEVTTVVTVPPTRPDPTRPSTTIAPSPPIDVPSTEMAPTGRRRDELFEAVAASCGVDLTRLTDSARGALNKAVAQLRGVHADPGEVAPRAAAYHRIYPTIALTPVALAKHWPQLDPAVVDMPARGNGRAANNAAQLEAARVRMAERGIV